MVDTLAVPAKALIDVPQIAETIQEGINTFMEAVPVLMKALDEVAKIHPFISGARARYHYGLGCLTVIISCSCCPCVQGRVHA